LPNEEEGKREEANFPGLKPCGLKAEPSLNEVLLKGE